MHLRTTSDQQNLYSQYNKLTLEMYQYPLKTEAKILTLLVWTLVWQPFHVSHCNCSVLSDIFVAAFVVQQDLEQLKPYLHPMHKQLRSTQTRKPYMLIAKDGILVICLSLLPLIHHSQLISCRLSLSTNGDNCAMCHGQFLGESIKSLILSFNVQKCEFCAQI